MSRTARGFIIAGSVVVALVLIVLCAWLFLTRLQYPKTNGRISVDGLNAPVEVLRDRYGVPHIYARTSHDLWFAEGFVHAQDRFWQMEFWRRLGAGRLSELFGKATLETDKFLRTLGIRKVAEAEYEQYSNESKGCFEAYAAGVNAYILHRKPWRLGLEFAVLKLQGVKYQIEPWTPADSITWGKMMAYDLSGQYLTERFNLQVLSTIGRGGWTSLFAPYRPDMPYTLDARELTKLLGPAARVPVGVGIPPQGDLALGSNNWVVSGSRTASGKPLLANDMHLGIQMPSIWYEIALHGVRPDGTEGRTPGCPFTLRGFSFPGTPTVVAGHNDRIAWGLTNFGGDVQDLYIEKINPDNPDQYMVNGKWVNMDIRVESLKVHAADEPYVFRVRSTRHGPILSDRPSWSDMNGYTMTSGAEFPAGVGLTAVSLRWTALQPSRLFESVCKLDRASNFSEFRDALRLWDVPAQNVIYADVDGNIGYQVSGLQPIRAHGHGLAPVPGWTDEYEWTGFVPFDKLPWQYNPEKGYIATANAPAVGPQYPFYLGSDFAYGERARRIRELIEATGAGMTIASMQRIQADVFDQFASELVPYLRNLDLAADDTAPYINSKPLNTKAMNAARDRLLAWDFQMRRESPEAALYAFFFMALLEETFRDQYPEASWPPDGTGRLQNALHYLLRDPHAAFWDNVNTPATKETRDQILVRAFRKGYRAAVRRLGENYDAWQWGKVHTAQFRNQTFGMSGITPIERIFNRGPIAVSGGNTTVAVAAWDPKKPFEVKHISSQRMIIDLGDLRASVMAHTTGQSGHPTNRHYGDLIEGWRDVKYHSSLWTRAQVEAASTERLRLEPGK